MINRRARSLAPHSPARATNDPASPSTLARHSVPSGVVVSIASAVRTFRASLAWQRATPTHPQLCPSRPRPQFVPISSGSNERWSRGIAPPTTPWVLASACVIAVAKVAALGGPEDPTSSLRTDGEKRGTGG